MHMFLICCSTQLQFASERN